MPENPSVVEQPVNPAISFRYLSEADMIRAGVTDMAACIDVMEEVFGLLHSGDYRMAGELGDSHGAMITFPEDSPFPTMPKATADRRFMAMPAYLGGRFGSAGVKWYGSNRANRDKGLPRSVLMFMLNDVDTGAPLALMSANLLSAYRTGAIPGVGARHLATADAATVGIVGPGVMARTSLSAFIAERPTISTVKVKGRSAAGIREFAAWVNEHYPELAVMVVDSAEEAVRDSDIVTYCASVPHGDPSTYPFLRRDWVKPGAYISLPAAANVDDDLLLPDVRKIVDNRRMYDTWAQEVSGPSHNEIPMIGCRFIDLIAGGELASADVEDLGAIVAGAAEGRRGAEIAILSVGGMPVEDVAWAHVLYQNALRDDIGTRLDLWDRPALR